MAWLLRDWPLIGQGGMGEVYRARDRRLGRDIAIKLLPAAPMQLVVVQHLTEELKRLTRTR